MSIALTEEHQELARVARAFLDSNDVRGESRALLEAPSDHLPSFWKEIAELGWMGLHVDEAFGGGASGYPSCRSPSRRWASQLRPAPSCPARWQRH